MRWQDLIPSLSDDESQTLWASIRAHGVREPIVVDQFGTVIDGANRKRIATELGVACPERQEVFENDLARAEAVVLYNSHRRHMTREARTKIATELRAMGLTQQQVAAAIGIPRQTIFERKSTNAETGNSGFDVRRKLTDEQIAEIRRRRAAGETCRVLADEYRVSDSLISQLCVRRRNSPLPDSDPRRKIPVADEAEIARRIGTGAITQEALAKEYGLTTSAIGAAVRRAGGLSAREAQSRERRVKDDAATVSGWLASMTGILHGLQRYPTESTAQLFSRDEVLNRLVDDYPSQQETWIETFDQLASFGRELKRVIGRRRSRLQVMA